MLLEARGKTETGSTLTTHRERARSGPSEIVIGLRNQGLEIGFWYLDAGGWKPTTATGGGIGPGLINTMDLPIARRYTFFHDRER